MEAATGRERLKRKAVEIWNTVQPMNTEATARPALLEMRGIRKSFDAVEVLHGVDFTARAGQVHALVGENGAGKSTLINILGGIHSDYLGTVRITGSPVRPRGARQAAELGIAVIHQETALVPHMSVAENIYLGREPCTRFGCVNWPAMRRQAGELLRGKLGAEIDVRRDVAALSVAARQIVEIAKALSLDARILVMDEPTSALSDSETDALFTLIRQLRRRGIAVIYISHKLDDIFSIADEITVLRDGVCVASKPVEAMGRDELVRHMVGRTIERHFPRRRAQVGEELLRIESLSVFDPGLRRNVVCEANMTCRRAEIVGIAGLLGSGASELLGAVFGRYGRRTTGRIFIDGRLAATTSPRRAMESGVALVTNDRQAEGLVRPMSSLRNLTLASLRRCCVGGVMSRRLERRAAEPLVARMSIRAASLDTPVATLSGGNQQKVVLGKWLMTEPRLLLCDEPTRGVDVGAKAEIYALLNELVESGMGLLLISSELPELLALSDRIYVMHRGRIVAQFGRDEATQERIMSAAMGD